MQFDSLPPLRQVVEKHKLWAKRGLGQNFLFDLNLTGRIARAAGPLEDVTCIEIGPGPGGLTRALLAHGARHIIAIEKDERCLAALSEIAQAYPGRLEIIAADALTFDFKTLAQQGTGPYRVISNLPYNIGTQILINLLRTYPWPPWYDRLVLMFQKEVALRLIATNTPATAHDYGRLSVLCGWRTQAQLLFDIPPSAFTPAPKVISSLVELVPRPTPLPCVLEKLEAVTAAAFGQRRKMLRQSLKQLWMKQVELTGKETGFNLEQVLQKAGFDPTARAQELDIADFVRLAELFNDISGSSDGAIT